MRSFMALCILMALFASANAAPRKPLAELRQAISHAGQAGAASEITPLGRRVFRDPTAPGGWRADRNLVPSLRDPSKYGGY
ncbi:MAG: hypothetical protein AB7I42_29425 [Bradyrhizobium sp.]|uniref:hypothetical protein n=2 Tax=Bradyrhizobium sp. TaxID=376 RepID=UPI003D0F1402